MFIICEVVEGKKRFFKNKERKIIEYATQENADFDRISMQPDQENPLIVEEIKAKYKCPNCDNLKLLVTGFERAEYLNQSFDTDEAEKQFGCYQCNHVFDEEPKAVNIEDDRFMSTEDAFEIIYELAKGNILTDKDVRGEEELKEEQKKQRLALDVVHDFLINNIYN